MTLYKNENLYKELVELSIIPKEKLEELNLKAQEEELILGDLLLDENLITDENLGKLVADIISVPFVILSKQVIDKSVLNILPEVYAKSKNIIAFKKDSQGIHLASDNPFQKQACEFIEKKTGDKTNIYYSTSKDIEKALNLYSKDVKKVFSEIIDENVSQAKESKKTEPSIIKIVDTIVSYAYQNNSSDIHIEPMDEMSLVRFRIDGVLHDIYDLPIELHPRIVTRVKVLASLRTDEHQAAQDGKISYKLQNDESDNQIDIRVSIVPVTDGEKIVMRLLSEKARQLSLTDLGLSNTDLKKLQDAYSKPHGMLLATGPTGSGKTTTLYAVLKLLNKRDINIMTIEDPVEYDIEHVNQIQVNTKTDLTFSKGLRSIVRQDPDIILVGEIRDAETADISVNAAMTGHLLLSTLHTNDAATTIPRLMDLGVEPFLISSTVNIIVAQRLVRKICDRCRISVELDIQNLISNKVSDSQKVIKELAGDGQTEKIRVYQGKGCPVCHNTGYVGRVGIFEVMLVEDNIRRAIVARKDAGEIRDIAVSNGMTTMLINGIEKVKKGETTIEEILRVTKD